MRFLALLALLFAGCVPSHEEMVAEERGAVARCQSFCRDLGSAQWSIKVTGVHGGCWCSGPVPELPVCPPRRPADGGTCP